jgi:hypothetical protein
MAHLQGLHFIQARSHAAARPHRLLHHSMRPLHVPRKLQLVKAPRLPRLADQQLVAVGAPCHGRHAALWEQREGRR